MRAPADEVRAVRLTAPLRIDGRLDEEVYGTVAPIDGFVQQLPLEGVPATEPTDLWVFFDEDNLYVAARCHDSQADFAYGHELRRDNNGIWQYNDNFTVAIDTFTTDGRFFFQTNRSAAWRDQAITTARTNVNFQHGVGCEDVAIRGGLYAE